MSSGTKIVSVDWMASMGEPAATRPSSGSSTARTAMPLGTSSSARLRLAARLMSPCPAGSSGACGRWRASSGRSARRSPRSSARTPCARGGVRRSRGSPSAFASGACGPPRRSLGESAAGRQPGCQPRVEIETAGGGPRGAAVLRGRPRRGVRTRSAVPVAVTAARAAGRVGTEARRVGQAAAGLDRGPDHDSVAADAVSQRYAAVGVRGGVGVRFGPGGLRLGGPRTRLRLADARLGFLPLDVRDRRLLAGAGLGRVPLDLGLARGRASSRRRRARPCLARAATEAKSSHRPWWRMSPRAVWATAFPGSAASTRRHASRAWVGRSFWLGPSGERRPAGHVARGQRRGALAVLRERDGGARRCAPPSTAAA